MFVPPYSYNTLRISEVYFQRAGYGDEYIWLEIYADRGWINAPGYARGVYIATKDTIYEDSTVAGTSGPDPKDIFLWLPKVDIPEKGFLVLCKNLTSFQEQWMVVGKGEVIDWKFTGGSGQDNVTFDNVSGYIQLRGGGGVNEVLDEVIWGDIAHPQGTIWNGDSFRKQLGGVTQGYSIQRIADAVQATSWELNAAPSPGAYFSFPEGEYLSVDIGTVSTVLESDLAANDTTAAVTGGTVGFDNVGSISISGESIPYTSKTGDSFSGLTVPHGAYPAGTPVFPVVGGEPNQLFPVVVITIKRPQGKPYPSVFRILGSAEGSPPYPDEDVGWQDHWTDILVGNRQTVYTTLTEDFYNGKPWAVVVSTNGFPNVGEFIAVEGTSREEVGYEEKDATAFIRCGPHSTFTKDGARIYRQAQSSTSSVTTSEFTTPLRFRHYMVVIYEMSDGGRAKISEIEIIGRNDEHQDGDGNNHTITDHSIGSLVTHVLVTHFGLPASKLQIVEGGSLSLVEQDLQKDGAGRILDSMAEMSGCIMVHQLANGVRWKYDPHLVIGVLEELRRTFDRDSLESPLTLTRNSKLDVSQVEVFARNPVTGLTMHVYWPTTPQVFGRKLVLRDLIIVGNEDRALLYAQSSFRRANFGSKITMIPLGIAEWLSPTSRIAIRYSQDTSDNPFFQFRDYIVSNVSWDVRRSGNEKYIRCTALCEEQVI
jgi:hypothetical protein